jgi:hypothetical protein
MPAITIDGDEELKFLVSSLPDRVLTEVGKSMWKGAKPIIKAAQNNLRKNKSVDTRLLVNSMGVRHLKSIRSENKVLMYIGPRFNFESNEPRKNKKTGRITKARKHEPWRIAHLVEFGHRIAVSKTSGKSEKGVKLTRYFRGGRVEIGEAVEHKKTVEGKPFLRPAVDANRANFLNELKAGLKKAIEKRAAKGEGYSMAVLQAERDGG